MTVADANISDEGDINVVELLQKCHSYHVKKISDKQLDTKVRDILTVWSRCAIVYPPHSSVQPDSLDAVFNTITDQQLDTKSLIRSLLVDKTFKTYVVDSLKRYHGLHDIMTLLPKCLDVSMQTVNIPSKTTNDFNALIKIVRSVTSRVVLVAIAESMNDDSQRYLANFIKKNDLPIPLSYYTFNVKEQQIEYIINFNLIAEILCLTTDRMLLQIGSPSAIRQGKSSLLPYMCLDKRRESGNTTGNASLRAGCLDVLSGIIRSCDKVEQAYSLFDLHGTVCKGINDDLVRAIQHYAAVLILYITLDDLESDVLSSLFSDIHSQPIIVVVFDPDFDDRNSESRLLLVSRCKEGLKRFLPTITMSSIAVVLAPCASLWIQESENRDFDESRRAQLLRQSFLDAFSQLESGIAQRQSLFRSSFMIQSLFLAYRSNNGRANTKMLSFAAERKLKQLLEKYTDQTDNLLMATPVSYLQAKIRTTEKQLTMDTEEDMRSVADTQKQLKAQLRNITSVSAPTRFFIELLMQGTFVELLVVEKYLDTWRSKYERPLQLDMSNIKQRAIEFANAIKRCEAEQLAIEKQSPPDPNDEGKRLDLARCLHGAKQEFAKIHHEVEKLEKKLMNIDLTVGLFLDEIMAISNFNPTLFATENNQKIIDRLAVCFVDLMNRGIALHILRGRPLQCHSPLLTKSIQIAGKNARSAPCVVSVIGEQSSAKSSLLNTCFGTNFRVSSGRCTIGIYASVVHWGELSVVLLDTEGLLSVEEASALLDNQIVTMAMLSSHLTIINHKGEFSTILSSLIGMSLYAKVQIKSAMKPALLFILRDQSDTTDETKRKHFLPQLTNLKQTLQSDAKFLTTSIDDVMEINSNAVILLSNAIVKDIDARMGINQNYRNKSFPIEIQELRRTIFASLELSSKSNVYSDFDNMSLMLASNWSVIDRLGPDLLSCKSLIELTRMTEVQSIAVEILKLAAASLNDQFEKLVERRLKELEPIKMTMASMNTASMNFQMDIQTTVKSIQQQALKEFAQKTNKSYYSTDVKTQWERTIVSSLKGLIEQWNYIFDNRLQASSQAKIVKEVEDTLIARAEERFNQDKPPNVEQLRKTMKEEIEELRIISQKNQQALFEQPDIITEKIIRLYNSCLQLHKHECGREIYNILPSMPVTDFIQHSENLANVGRLLEDFLKKSGGKIGIRQRLLNFVRSSNELDSMWRSFENRIQWFNSSDVSKNCQILIGIANEVLPKLQGDLRQLIKVSQPIYNKTHVMEQAIDMMEGAMRMREVADHKKHLNRNIFVADLAVIALRLLVDESINVGQQYYNEKMVELENRIKSLKDSVDRQISSMEDSSKQGNELATTVTSALFREVRRIMNAKITCDIRQAVTASDHIIHENVQNQAYTSSFTMANAENILKYVTNINLYFLEVSLDSIRAIFNAVIHNQTAQLESLLNTLLGDINNEVNSNSCNNYAEVNKMIEERANKSFMDNTKGHTNVNFKFPAALPMGIPNSDRFKSAFRIILQTSSEIPGKVTSIIASLRGAAFDQCVRAIQQKLGCNQCCPGCGSKCEVTTDHEERIVPRMPRPDFDQPSDANSSLQIHRTKHHLAACFKGGHYYKTNQPLLSKCYQQWTSGRVQLSDTEIVSPKSLYYNHFHATWYDNLTHLAEKSSDRNAEHAENDQRRAWMLVRRFICQKYQLNDYSDSEYTQFPEHYPMVESLPPDFTISWNDTSL
ncbi:unnamed protein product [Rotaria socialis]